MPSGRPSSRDALRRAADFRRALRRFHVVTERVVRSHGLTPRQYLVLLVLEASDSQMATVGELTSALHLVPSTVTELLDRAEEAGLITRSHPAHDGRVSCISATAQGRKRLMKAFHELDDERQAVAGTALLLRADGT